MDYNNNMKNVHYDDKHLTNCNHKITKSLDNKGKKLFMKSFIGYIKEI